MKLKKATRLNAGKSVPGKLTSVALAAICESHADGLPLIRACHRQHVTMSAFYLYMQKHPGFKVEVFDPARALFVCKLEEKAFAAAMDSDPRRYPTMLIFMLKAHKPEVYRETVKVQPTGDFAAAFFAAMEKTRDAIPATQH